MEEKKSIHLFVPAYLHKEIRITAAQNEMSIMSFCLRAILGQLGVPNHGRMSQEECPKLKTWLDERD